MEKEHAAQRLWDSLVHSNKAWPESWVLSHAPHGLSVQKRLCPRDTSHSSVNSPESPGCVLSLLCVPLLSQGPQDQETVGRAQALEPEKPEFKSWLCTFWLFDLETGYFPFWNIKFLIYKGRVHNSACFVATVRIWEAGQMMLQSPHVSQHLARSKCSVYHDGDCLFKMCSF